MLHGQRKRVAGTEPGRQKVKKSRGKQMNRNAGWPAEKGGHQQCRHRTWEAKVKKSPGKQMNRNAVWPARRRNRMASGKGRTPAVQAPNLGWETKLMKSPGRRMNRNAAWPAEKGGHQQCRHRTWETKVRKSPGRQMNRSAAMADTSSDRKGGHMLKMI